MQKFRYFSPKTVSEAVLTLSQLDGTAKVLAGGTDLLPMMKQRAITPGSIVNIKNITELAYIREDADGLKIGAMTTIADIKESDIIKQKCVSLYEAARKFGTPVVRNMATMGGNICRSSPSADTVPPLMVFDAEVKLVGPKGERGLLLEDFFTGPGENVLKQELLTEIIIPKKEDRYGTAFEKVGRSSADLAKLNCAVRITVSGGRCDDIRIALGAVADKPIRAKKAEQAIKGKTISDEATEAAAQKVTGDIAAITDVRSTAVYRTDVSKVLVRRLIKLAVERI
jgi:carbon-monoxide dehydrogenase medium subunit